MLAQELTTVLLAPRITGVSHRTHLRYVAQGPGDNSTYLPLVFSEFPTPSLRQGTVLPLSHSSKGLEIGVMKSI